MSFLNGGIRFPGHILRMTADRTQCRPITGPTGAGAGLHVALEIVPAVHDPEHGGMDPIGLVGKWPPGRCRQDAWYLAGIVPLGSIAIDFRHGPGIDADVRIYVVVDLRAVLEVIAMADGQIADVARERDVVGAVDGVQRVIESCTDASCTTVVGGVLRARWKWTG
jgi:hypothetical protein